MAASKRPSKSETQKQGSESKSSKKEEAASPKNAAPEADATELKKTSVQNSEKESSPSSSPSSGPGEAGAGVRKKTTSTPSGGTTRPGRGARLAGIVVLGFVAGIIGGGGAGYVLLQNKTALGLEAAAPDDTRWTSIQQGLEELRGDNAALQQRSAGLEEEVERLRVQGSSRNGPDSAAFGEFVDRVTGLEQALALALKDDAPGAPAFDGTAMTQLNSALSAVREDLSLFEDQMKMRLEGIERNAPPENLGQLLEGLAPLSSVQELGMRLDALESDRSGSDAKRAALSLSLAGLMRAADRGEPFTAELETIALLAPEQTQWQNLEPYAAHGLRPAGLLIRDFDEVARGVLKAERMHGIETWWQRLWANISGLVTVRRTGDLKGQTSEAMIARAEQHLKEGNLRAAAHELQGLSGAAGTSIAPWLGEVEGRLKLDDLVSSLSSGLLLDLGGQEKTP